MKPFPSLGAWRAAVLATLFFPWLAAAHPGHDHSNIPAVIRHPLAGGEHVAIVVALVFGLAGTLVVLVQARRASTRHGARARTVRVR